MLDKKILQEISVIATRLSNDASTKVEDSVITALTDEEWRLRKGMTVHQSSAAFHRAGVPGGDTTSVELASLKQEVITRLEQEIVLAKLKLIETKLGIKATKKVAEDAIDGAVDVDWRASHGGKSVAEVSKSFGSLAGKPGDTTQFELANLKQEVTARLEQELVLTRLASIETKLGIRATTKVAEREIDKTVDEEWRASHGGRSVEEVSKSFGSLAGQPGDTTQFELANSKQEDIAKSEKKLVNDSLVAMQFELANLKQEVIAKLEKKLVNDRLVAIYAHPNLGDKVGFTPAAASAAGGVGGASAASATSSSSSLSTPSATSEETAKKGPEKPTQ